MKTLIMKMPLINIMIKILIISQMTLKLKQRNRMISKQIRKSLMMRTTKMKKNSLEVMKLSLTVRSQVMKKMKTLRGKTIRAIS